MMPVRYAAPATLAEGLAASAPPRPPNRVRYLAGGTDLLPLLKSGIDDAQALVSLRHIEDLPRDIACREDESRLGALCTLADIAQHAALATRHRALVQAARMAASPQLRNMATLGGTLLQRPRCWYFRHPAFHCWLKGGSECHARQGLNQAHAIFDTGVCRAAHPSDLACALVALDARVELQGPDGSRRIDLREFLQPPTPERRTETTLRPHEMIVAVRIPTAVPGTRSIFLKAMDRAAWSFATVSVAATLRIEQGKLAALELVLGAVATVPWPIGERLACLLGHALDEKRLADALRDALDQADPLTMNAYKVPLARRLAQRAVLTLVREI